MIKFNGSVRGEGVVIVLEEKGVVKVELEMSHAQCQAAAVFFMEADLELARVIAAQATAVECTIAGKVTK